MNSWRRVPLRFPKMKSLAIRRRLVWEEAEINEVIRLAKPGARFTFSGPLEGNPFFSKLSEGLKGKATLVSESSEIKLKGTSDEYTQKTVIYEFNK